MNLLVKLNNEIEFVFGDLASFQNVNTAAEKIKNKYSMFDVLINNAGLFSGKRKLSEDGYELIFTVDYLAQYYFALLLLDNIKAAAPVRII